MDVASALNRERFFLCATQRRKQQRGENGNDGDDYEQLDEREAGIPRRTATASPDPPTSSAKRLEYNRAFSHGAIVINRRRSLKPEGRRATTFPFAMKFFAKPAAPIIVSVP